MPTLKKRKNVLRCRHIYCFEHIEYHRNSGRMTVTFVAAALVITNAKCKGELIPTRIQLIERYVSAYPTRERLLV